MGLILLFFYLVFFFFFGKGGGGNNILKRCQFQNSIHIVRKSHIMEITEVFFNYHTKGPVKKSTECYKIKHNLTTIPLLVYHRLYVTLYITFVFLVLYNSCNRKRNFKKSRIKNQDGQTKKWHLKKTKHYIFDIFICKT